MQAIPTLLVGLVDRCQQDVAGPGTDGFVAFDAAEAGVAVAGVAEAADENPFQHVLPPVPHVPLHFPLHFQGVTALNDGRNDPC